MAVTKKAAKPAAKKEAPKKQVAKAAKPAAPAKKAVKPAAKPAKPVAKTPAKSPAKSAAKAPARAVIKTPAKPAAKAPAKAPAKPVASKPVAKKPEPKVAVKTAPVKSAKAMPVKAAPAKAPIAPAKPASAPAPAAPAAKKAAPVAAKPAAKVTPVATKPAAPKVSRAAISTKDIKVIPAKPVTLPKFSTKNVRKYAPDFTKSVLDKPKNEAGSPIVRYSDAELKEFKDLIMRKLEAAKKELNYLQGLITRKDEMGGDESENRYMTMEDGSLSMEREQLSQMASRQITFIDHLEKALMRIENKTYGICRVTGKLIDKARLRAVPHATLSIEAKMGIVK